jgi:hypothetical protein
MKFKLQMIASLLFVAIIVSMVAVTVGWYSAEGGEVFMEGTSVSITTADNNYYDGSTGLNYKGCLVKTGDQYKYVEYKPYRGETGVGNELYILLLTSDVPIYSKAGSGYIDFVNLKLPDGITIFDEKTKDEFRVLLLVDNQDGTYSIAEDTEENTYQCFAIIFGNGTTDFKYSDRKYIGSSFNLNIYLEN